MTFVLRKQADDESLHISQDGHVGEEMFPVRTPQRAQENGLHY